MVEQVEAGEPGEGVLSHGLRVLEVDPEGSSVRGGVAKGDILMRWDEQLLFTPVQFRRLLRTLAVGGKHSVVFRRGGEESAIEVTLLGRDTVEVEDRITRVVRVPYEAWAKGTAWVEQLEALAVLPDSEAGEGREVSADIARVLGSWLEVEGNVPEWVVFLQDAGAGESTNAVERVLPVPGAPLISTDGQGMRAVSGDEGVVEVTKRGGREYVVVRDAQGAVLYEGPMENEQDAVLLRPLRPALRRSAESVMDPLRQVAEPLDVELWRWKVPAKFF
jgi:hypothetical protein